MATSTKKAHHRSSAKSSKNQKKAKKPKPASPAVLAAESQAAVRETLGSLLVKHTGKSSYSIRCVRLILNTDKAPSRKAKHSVVEESESDNDSEGDDDDDDEEGDEKDARIRELEEYIETLSQMQSPPTSQQPAGPIFEKPEGKPGRSTTAKRKGYKLQPALGVSKEVFNNLKSHARKGLTLFKFNTKETFRQQELRKRQAMFPHMLEEFPELITKQRYPRLWVIDVLTQYCFNNRRAYQLKKARSATGTKTSGRSDSLSPPPSAQRPPAFPASDDEEEDTEVESEDEKLFRAMSKLLKKKPKYASRLGLKRKAVSTEDEDEAEDAEAEEPPRAQRHLERKGSASQDVENDKD